jgi:hypothetical protein
MFQWLKRSLAKPRDYRDAGLDWHMRRLTAAIRRFSRLGSTPVEQVRWEDQLEWWSLNCPRQPPALNDPWMPVGVAHILKNRVQPSELFFRDRLWARYEDVWRASDGVIDHTLAFASASWKTAKSELPKGERERAEIVWETMGRACLTAREVIWLCRGGYSYGASSRARTMLELAVVADILADASAETVRRYKVQSLRTAKHAAMTQERHLGNLFGDEAAEDVSFARSRVLELDTEIRQLMEADSEAGKVDSGFWWARPELRRRGISVSRNERIGFDQLAESTELAGWLPFYRLFNRPIHAGHEAQQDLYVNRRSDRAFLVGPSDSGFVDPVQVALKCLLHVVALLTKSTASPGHERTEGAVLGWIAITLPAAANEVVSVLTSRDPRLNSEDDA